MIKPNDIEKRIDGAIASAAIVGKWPATAGIRGESPAVVDQLLARYRAAGWTIRRITDTREGDYIEVTQP